ELIPDQDHTLMSAGYDALACMAGNASIRIVKYQGLMAKMLHRLRNHTFLASNTCAMAARTSDGSLVIAYLPSLRTITINMSKLASMTIAHWYDPTSGEYVNVKGSPFSNAGSRQFSPPGINNSGDGDWALVLEAQTVR